MNDDILDALRVDMDKDEIAALQLEQVKRIVQSPVPPEVRPIVVLLKKHPELVDDVEQFIYQRILEQSAARPPAPESVIDTTGGDPGDVSASDSDGTDDAGA